ncbi:hypothetical protein J2W40_000031 [Sphingobium xenophagum]|uniref:Uncharacterized protein n=1 Tax=Sphingobium xenophagum TaxID=121428 RepID=A0ABU1WVA4_SPHXE|nr:hypothetical protein [Sphingobium xenophagum]MDR7153237.1 hypothetical protein [Sphingobium xenophagum]
MSFSGAIESWFDKEWGGGLILPDGWFGRPHDSQHSLTSLAENGDSLTMILDGDITLQFKKLKMVSPSPEELLFRSFDSLRFEWQAPDGGPQEAKEYTSGEVRIVSAPG